MRNVGSFTGFMEEGRDDVPALFHLGYQVLYRRSLRSRVGRPMTARSPFSCGPLNQFWIEDHVIISSSSDKLFFIQLQLLIDVFARSFRFPWATPSFLMSRRSVATETGVAK